MFEVHKHTQRVYHTRTRQTPDRWGNVETARSRLQTQWVLTVPGRPPIAGFARRRDAVAAGQKLTQQTLSDESRETKQ